MGEFNFDSEDPAFEFSASFEDTISIKVKINQPSFFKRLKDAFLTVCGYSVECCINLTGEDARRLKMTMLESLYVENACDNKSTG